MDQWVVFDLDGTLIESEQIWRDVRRDFAIQHGARWHEGAQQAMMGMPTEQWAQYMRDVLGVQLDASTIARETIALVSDRFARHVPVLPGADAALERLSREFTLGLATSAALPVVHIVLQRTGWQKYFAQVVSADDVARGKPAPDVYLRALELLRADAERAAAVEDSANGIRSGYAAQLAVIAIPNREFAPDPESLALATCVLSNLDELRAETVRDAISRRRR